jgi:thiamine kinase-like enzyme
VRTETRAVVVAGGLSHHVWRVDAGDRSCALASVPCHNDLLPENLLDVGGDIRIVDYQLSGSNDPTFELGDIAAGRSRQPAYRSPTDSRGRR